MAPSLTIHCSVTEHREYRDLDDRESSSSGDRSTVVDMTTTVETLPCPPQGHDLVLRSPALAYLGRYTGTSPTHTESDLRSRVWSRAGWATRMPRPVAVSAGALLGAGDPVIDAQHLIPRYDDSGHCGPDGRGERHWSTTSQWQSRPAADVGPSTGCTA